jgi:ribosomal protein S18 acetylase RimI-like enzyme
VDDVIIRNARPADVAELIEFWDRAGENGSRPRDRPSAVERLIERDPAALIVAELDGRVVATVIAGWDGWRANLYRLAVDPDVRGQGLGRRMLSSAEDRLRAVGAERLCAMVLDSNALGRSLWESADYVRQDDWRRWVKPAG